MRSAIRQIAQGLSHILYPRLCEACYQPLLAQEQVLCIGCETYLPLTHYHPIADNETSNRLAGRFPFQHATSLAYFTEENLLQHLLHRLKYKNRQGIGLYLGEMIGEAIQPLGWGIDAVVAVPLHVKKQAKRGYNQSLLIGEGITRILRVPLLENTIERIKNTATQTDKNRQERIDNVRNSFRVKTNKALEGKHLLVADDVLTTGATLEACAHELLNVKGLKLSIATAGIAI
jgi:ComF family protein